MDTKAKRRILAAKRKARPELKDEISWCKYDYAKNFDVSLESVHDNIQRVDTRTISHSEFVEKFEKPRIPVVLTHSIDHWRGYRKWTIEKLARKYGNQKFKVGEDDDGYSVKMKMKYYVEYIQNNNDDSPLYIFDSSYADNPKKKKLRDDYEIPRFFVDDLFRYAGEKRRPPYRFLFKLSKPKRKNLNKKVFHVLSFTRIFIPTELSSFLFTFSRYVISRQV
ncbi:bifunctional arginine demethylase and lysyl-hydroxylase JMJD6 [Exaiptasia diaphana]|uniref:Uncharacterized protein n=1 Tax=Exaiptasia diaphana TaxID=2652724 RepID=A0A913YSZ8_EXADI|nr:bifunctional arginine demethylase and lysyl-hydroxylase JMJD6 [Exaiptasia diaphana]